MEKECLRCQMKTLSIEELLLLQPLVKLNPNKKFTLCDKCFTEMKADQKPTFAEKYKDTQE